MIVFKNDERLGMMAAGLAGSYCWATVLYNKGAAVTIKALPVPKVQSSARIADDMTEDEAALAIQARVRSRGTKTKADETRPAT